jgi:hypothetical protein
MQCSHGTIGDGLHFTTSSTPLEVHPHYLQEKWKMWFPFWNFYSEEEYFSFSLSLVLAK